MSENEKFFLKWDDESFIPSESVGSEGLYLELKENDKIWSFQYTEGIGFIARRTALRRANEIAKVGYVHPVSGKRIGINFKCIEAEDTYANLPEKVTRAEDQYNK